MRPLLHVISTLVLFCGMNFQLPVSQAQKPAGTEELERSADLNAQVVKLYSEGHYDQAVPLARQVIEISRRLLPPDDPALGAAFTNLAELYFALKRDSEAEKEFEHALSVYELHEDRNGVRVSNALERVAVIRFSKHDYSGAESNLRRSLTIREKIFGPDNVQVGETLYHLANVYQAKKEFEQADPLYLRALTIQEKELGRSNPKTVAAMKDYACLDLRMDAAHPETRESRRYEPNDAKRALRLRASCWLTEWKSDCTQDAPHPKVEGVINGKAIKLVQPSYPKLARSKQLSGTVFAAVLIDESGNVIEAKTVCGGFAE